MSQMIVSVGVEAKNTCLHFLFRKKPNLLPRKEPLITHSRCFGCSDLLPTPEFGSAGRVVYLIHLLKWCQKPAALPDFMAIMVGSWLC